MSGHGTCLGSPGGPRARFEPGPPLQRSIELNGREHAVAVRDDLAAGDLRRVGDDLVEVLVGDPLRDEHRRLVGLLGGLEETEGAEDAAAALDQVVAGEARKLTELRDERLVDLADNLVDPGHVDTLVTTNGRMHVMLLLFLLQGSALEWAHCGGQATVTVGEEGAKSLGGFNS